MSGAGAAALQQRLEVLRRTASYQNYELVRSRVLEMRTLEAQLPHYRPSAYWEEELTNFEYMLDASPLVIDKLRHHAMHITGIRPYEYRSNRDRWRGAQTWRCEGLRSCRLRLRQRFKFGTSNIEHRTLNIEGK